MVLRFGGGAGQWGVFASQARADPLRLVTTFEKPFGSPGSVVVAWLWRDVARRRTHALEKAGEM